MTPGELAVQAIAEWDRHLDPNRSRWLKIEIEKVIRIAVTDAIMVERVMCANLCAKYASEHRSDAASKLVTIILAPRKGRRVP